MIYISNFSLHAKRIRLSNILILIFVKVFEVMRKQEKTRLAELDAEKAHFEAIQAHADIVSLLI